MEQDVLRTNFLAIAGAGVLIMLTGSGLYIFRDYIGANSRYFLPIPPLGVASYIFIFNMFRHYEGHLPESIWTTVKEILLSTAIAALAFGLFTSILIIIITLVKR